MTNIYAKNEMVRIPGTIATKPISLKTTPKPTKTPTTQRTTSQYFLLKISTILLVLFFNFSNSCVCSHVQPSGISLKYLNLKNKGRPINADISTPNNQP